MADASRAAARARPGAIPLRKQVKSNQQTSAVAASKASAAVKPRPPPPIQTSVPVASSSTTATTATILPKIDRCGEQLHSTNNNSSSSDIINNSSLAMAISPQARVLPPPSLPLPFRRPSFSGAKSEVVDAGETSPTTRSEIREGPLASKAAWCTPRSPTTSHLEAFFAVSSSSREELDGLAIGTSLNRHEDDNTLSPTVTMTTPARLQSVEESLRASDERYRIDLDALLADNQKFFDITTTANQHLESIHDELPQISTTYDKTTSALADFSKGIATLHEQQKLFKDKMLQQLDQVFNQGTDEKLALMEVHEAEKAQLHDVHAQELQDLDAQYRTQLEALDKKYNDMKTTCLNEIRELQASSAAELAATRDHAATELAQLKESSRAEKDAVEDALQLQILTLQAEKASELEELRCSSSTAYEALQAKFESEFSELVQTSKTRYEDLERTSNETLDAVRAKATSEFVEATDQLKRELEALQESKESELTHLRAEYLSEKTRLVQESDDAMAKMKQEHENQVTRLETQRMEETAALQSALETLHDSLTLEIQTLKQQHVSENEAMRAVTEQTVRALKSAHASQLHEMEAATSLKLSETIVSYEATLSSASAQHTAELVRANEGNAASLAALASKHETELTELRDESKREKDLVVLTYETKLEALTKANKAQLENTLKAHDATLAQLRDMQNANVLRLEAAIREQETKFVDTVALHDAEIMRRDAQLQDLQTRLDALTATHEQHVDLSKQIMTRKGMEMCENEARMLAVQQELTYQREVLETTRKELTAASDDRVVKANTILELTFVIKSRDDEIERLRNALLDSIQSVNQKTEILELTAESLSTKAKELEDTKAALRKESGRLSRVEESMHHKEEILEDTEMKIESMRLNMDNLRLEMKRMQMDMTLQLQHTEGEMALKNGEISRLYVAQSELKQKNDFHQRTIDRLEDTLARTQRQCNDAERRITLLRLETTQYADDTQKTREELLAKEQELLTLTNNKHNLSQDKQRVQIQLNNAAQALQRFREQREQQWMHCEEHHVRFLRVLKETSAEKDERLRAEKHVLCLELAATRDQMRHLEGVEARLQASQSENAAQQLEMQALEAQLQASITQCNDLETRIAEKQQHIEELQTTIDEKEHALACTHDKMRVERDMAQRSLAALTASLDELTAQKVHLSGKKDALQHESEDLSKQNGELQRQLENSRTQNDKLTGALDGERKQNDDLQQELSDKRKQIVELQQELEGTRAQKDELQHHVDSVHKQNDELQHQIEDVRKQNDELTRALSGEKLDMVAKIDSMLLELDTAKSTFGLQLQDAAAKLENSEAALQRLQQKHAQTLMREADLEMKVQDHEAQIAALTAKNAALQAHRDDLEVKVHDLEQVFHDKLSLHLQDVKGAEHELQLKSDAYTTLVVEMETQRRSHAGEFAALQAEMEEKSRLHAVELAMIRAVSGAEHDAQRSTLNESFVAQAQELLGPFAREKQALEQLLTAQLKQNHAGPSGAELAHQQFVDDHLRKLNEAKDAKNKLMHDHERALETLTRDHEAALATQQAMYADRIQCQEQDHNAALEALKITHGDQLQTVKQDHEALVRDFEAKLALADTTARVVEARTQEAEMATLLLKQECDDKIRILTEELQRDAEMSCLRVTEEHLRKLEEVVENARVNEQQQQCALDDVQAALNDKTQRFDVASQQLTQCKDQIRDLQRNVETSESELRDAKQLIIARTSTVDSLRKELAELYEATEATSSELSVEECLARLRQQLDAHLWTRYRLDRSQVPGLVYTTEADVFECLQQFVRIRCARLKRHDEEEKEDSGDKKSETRLEAALVLSVDDVCMRVRDYDVVASTYGELFKDDNSSALTKKVSSEVAQVLTEFTQLVQRIEALFRLHLASEESAKSRHTVSSLLLKLESYATLLVKLGLIGVEDPHARGDEILKMCEQHDAFLQHAATLWNSETMQLSSLEDIGALLTQVHDVLEFARGTIKCERGECNTLADIKALVAELAYLWTVYDTYTTTQDAKSSLLEPHNAKSDGSVDSHASMAAKSAEIARFVDNSTRFIADCQAVLQLSPFNNEASSFDPPTCSTDEILRHIRAILRSMDNSTHFVANCRAVLRLDPLNKETSSSDSSSTDQILQCIQELMAVLDHFDAFQSLPMARINSDGAVDTSAHSSTADNDSALASIQRKVGIVRTFLDELHLMTDFAQSILDEESDATASTDALGSTSTNMSNSNSNSSSRESLQGFRALTRTSTPTSVGFDGSNEYDERPTNLEIDVPDPLNELELDLQQRDDDMTSGFASNAEFAGEDDDDLVAGTLPFKANGKAPPPSSPLADSLVDISLVMNDHHRILSEAAHWVHKTARLRRRSLSGQVQQKKQPRDLGSEICRLVREHCAVLSLAKKLFELKDPRHDLSMLLECLAILKRLTTRLPVFRQGGNYLQGHTMPPSDSSESLLRNSSTTSSMSSLTGAAAPYAGENRNNVSLQSSLSIFACIEDIARHLQDYDFFLQQMQTNREKQWLSDHSNTSSLDFVPNIEIVTRDVTARLKLLATIAQSLGLQDPSIELPQLCERIQTLVARCTSLDPWKTSESTDDLHNEAEPDNMELDNEAMEMTDLTDSETTSELRVTLQSTTKSYAAGLDDIERDLTAYTTFIDWLRRALPFSQSVESVDDLQLRTQSILVQLEHFANENVELREQVAVYYAEREQQKQQQEQEDAFLAAHGVNVAVVESAASDAPTNDGSGASSSTTRSRIAIFEQLLSEQRLATKTSDIDANMSLETEYLVVHGLLPPLASNFMTPEQPVEQTGDEHEKEEPRQQLSTQTRIQIYAQLLQRLEEQMTAHQHLEVAHQKLTMTLEEQEQRLEEQMTAYQNLEMTYRKLEMVVEEKQQRLEEQITVQRDLEMARRELEMALEEKQQYQDEQMTAQRKLEMVLEEQQQRDCERINAVTTSLHGMQQSLEMALNEQQQSAYERVNAVTASLHDLQSRLAACVSNENAFLQAHGIVLPLPPGEISGDTKDTMTLVADRIPVYEHFVAAITRLEAVQQQVRDELSAEQRALEQFGLVGVSTEAEKVKVEAEATASGAETATDRKDQGVFRATAAPSTASLPVTLSTRLALYERLAQLQAQMRAQSDAVAAEKAFLETHLLQLDAANAASSRMDVYKTLLDGQNALIDEKMEREVDLERENAFLARNGLPCEDRMSLFEDMVALRHELDARDNMDAREQTFLKEHELWMPEVDEKEKESTSIDTKMDAQERFDMRFRAFTELIEARAVQEQNRQHRQAAIEAEKAYLTQQCIVNLGDAVDFAAPGFSRLRVFETFVDAHEAAQAAWETQNSHAMAHFLDHETQFLMKNGLQVSTLQNQELEGDSEENASTLRRKVYKELFCRIRMREAQVNEVTAQRERCETLLMASNEVPLVAMHHVELLARETEQLRSESAEREAQLDRCKQDQALAIEIHATELARLQSTHDEALAMLQANHDEAFAKLQSTHDETLARLQTTHADALANFGAQRKQELAAALAKQAKQLEFVALVRAEEESHQHQFSHTQNAGQSGVSPIQARALLLDKFAKRDTAVISMIYRSIRLATDILNTSAFVGGSSSAAGPATPMTAAHASEISVEVTQSVLNCVKELKALKEYLIESLEQLTRGDDVFPSQPPPFVKLNIANALASSASSSEDPREKNEAAIDFALCSHREFMNYAHLQLLAREEAMHSTFTKLTNSLQGIARGDEYDSNNSNSTGVEAFTVSQQKFMQLEMDAVRESETRQNVDCKFHLNETYYHRLLDERKEVEVTLNNALEDLRAECKTLRAKVDTLERERYTAPPPSSASSAGLYGSISSPSPRATPMMSVSNSSNFGLSVTPMRPEKPRDGGVSKPGGSIHKERFVSDLEKETGQRRSEATYNTTSARRIHEWKKQDELLQLSSSSHLEHEFRAMQAATTTASSLAPVAEASTSFKRGGSTANGPRGGVGPNPHDQELWYQGVRSVHYISFFVSIFHVPKQNLFRVEVFNSETEQQQTIYVMWSELEAFLSESKKARNLGLSLHDAIKRSEIADVLFERVRVYGEGTPNILLGFE